MLRSQKPLRQRGSLDVKPSHLFIIFLGAAAGIWWAAERNTTARLRLQLEVLHRDTAELMRLRQERERLLRLQPPDDELDRLRREIVARSQPGADKPDERAATNDHSLQRGIWTAPAEWKNCGRDTPESALETTFWAAAGGELGVLKDAFEFDDAARAKAESILAGLPESSRVPYATPEDLLALVVARDIPLDDVQWFARTQHDPDTITDSVVLRNPEGKTQQVHLTFHHGENGWRLVVPDNAVEGMVRAITGAPPPQAMESKGADVQLPQGAEPTGTSP